MTQPTKPNAALADILESMNTYLPAEESADAKPAALPKAAPRPAPALDKPVAQRRPSVPVPPPPGKVKTTPTLKKSDIDEDTQPRVRARKMFGKLPHFPVAALRSALDDIGHWVMAVPLGWKLVASAVALALAATAMVAAIAGPEVRYLTSEQKLWASPGETHGHTAALAPNDPVRLVSEAGDYALVVDSFDRAGYVRHEFLTGSPQTIAMDVLGDDPVKKAEPAARPKKVTKKPKRK